MSNIRPYLIALRPWTLSASLTPVLLGTALCYQVHRHFSVTLTLVCAVTVLAVHAAGNLVNTYYDYKKGVDSRSESTEDRTLVDGHLNSNQVVSLAVNLYGCGTVGFLILMLLSPAQSELLAGLFFGGLSSSFLYTGGIGLKYYVMGDLLVIITFGPLAVLFSYMVQCGNVSWSPLVLAFPLALNTEALIHSKHVRNIAAHQQTGAESLAVMLGHQGSYFLFTLLLFLPYIIFVYWMVQFSVSLGLPLVTLPYAFSLERKFRESRGQVSIGLAQLNLILGLLMVLGCMLSTSVP